MPTFSEFENLPFPNSFRGLFIDVSNCPFMLRSELPASPPPTSLLGKPSSPPAPGRLPRTYGCACRFSAVCYGSNLGAGQALRPLPRVGAAAGRERVQAGRAEWRGAPASAGAPEPAPPAATARRGGERGGPASSFATSRKVPLNLERGLFPFPRTQRFLGAL